MKLFAKSSFGMEKKCKLHLVKFCHIDIEVDSFAPFEKVLL